MAHGNPEDVAARWAQGLAGSTQRIADGVKATTVAPGHAAARQADVWAANTVQAKEKWKARVASVSLQEWQQAVLDKGVARIGGGATAAQPKFAAFMADFLPHVDRVRDSLPARGNLDQNIERMTRFVRGMSQYKRRS